MSHESVFIIEISYVEAESYDSYIIEKYGWGDILNIVWILKGVCNGKEFYNIYVHFKSFKDIELKRYLENGGEVKINYNSDDFWTVKVSRFSPKNIGFSPPQDDVDSLINNFTNLNMNKDDIYNAETEDEDDDIDENNLNNLLRMLNVN